MSDISIDLGFAVLHFQPQHCPWQLSHKDTNFLKSFIFRPVLASFMILMFLGSIILQVCFCRTARFDRLYPTNPKSLLMRSESNGEMIYLREFLPEVPSIIDTPYSVRLLNALHKPRWLFKIVAFMIRKVYQINQAHLNWTEFSTCRRLKVWRTPSLSVPFMILAWGCISRSIEQSQEVTNERFKPARVRQVVQESKGVDDQLLGEEKQIL